MCLPLLRHAPHVPVLGVCLGLQALGVVHGARCVRAPAPAHGRVARVRHGGHPLFDGVASPFAAVRYHSLVVAADSLPPSLVALAWTDDPDAAPPGLLMGLRHAEWPHFGVQFHPESCASEGGLRLVQNFGRFAEAHHAARGACRSTTAAGWLPPGGRHAVPRPLPRADGHATPSVAPLPPGLRVMSHRLPLPRGGGGGCVDVGPRLFWGVVSPDATVEADCFWLDSAARGACARPRWSYMGGAALRGPLWQKRVFRLDEGGGGADDSAGSASESHPPPSPGDAPATGWLSTSTLLSRAPAVRRSSWAAQLGDACRGTMFRAAPAPGDAPPPCDFWGGWVGYMGYELRAEWEPEGGRSGSGRGGGGGSGRDSSRGEGGGGGWRGRASPDAPPHPPDGVLSFADRVLCIRAGEGGGGGGDDVWAVALVPTGDAAAAADASAWLESIAGEVAHALGDCGGGSGCDCGVGAAPPAPAPAPPMPPPCEVWSPPSSACDDCAAGSDTGGSACCGGGNGTTSTSKPTSTSTPACSPPPGAFVAARSDGEYAADVAGCQALIGAGETYQVCLTQQLFRAAAGVTPRALYPVLRRTNPAPYSLYLRIGDSAGSSDPNCLALCGCSPERFLRLSSTGAVEAKPIKGTAARVAPHGCAADADAAARLAASPKERAENLMITDLLRNDVGRVAVPGSVAVPVLCGVESFASVHQLVSTVSAQLAPHAACDTLMAASFPPGSMTGAPKLRTCGFVHALERGARRGPYAGCAGYISSSGASDWAVTIRTVVFHRGALSIGAGGAVTALSRPQEEVAEMRLKAAALLAAVAAVDAELAQDGAHEPTP